MIEMILRQFQSFYDIPGLTSAMVLKAVGLALGFSLVWLAIFQVWQHRKLTWLWVLITGAVLTWSAVAFIQVPLQIWTQNGLLTILGREGFLKWLYLSGAPIVLISGLVQEAAKLVPVMVVWRIKAKLPGNPAGFYYGAISGAGFGSLEAVWVHNMIFASGWTWQTFSYSGPLALLGFIERFFSLGFHIAVSALAGYGWVTGRRYQYFLLAAGLHGLINYAVILAASNVLGAVQIEIYVAVIALVAIALALRVKRRIRADSTFSTPETPLVT